MHKAVVFNIQKFCVHDGPGIRTTIFFKGCPLRCSWCHNPESQGFERELLYDAAKCTLCGECVINCPRAVLTLAAGALAHNAAGCSRCGACTDSCLNGARTLAGEEYTVAQLLAEVEKDRPFYEQSGGGVTLSGGEALCQIDFVEALVKECCRKGIGVAIDTCGYVPFDSFARVMEYIDLFLYDLKLWDPAAHKVHTGYDNGLILANLQELCRRGARVNLRLPLVAGVNDDEDNIGGIIAFAKSLGITAVNLLPYHDIGRDKYRRLNKPAPAIMAGPPEERLEEIRRAFTANGFAVEIGG